jgi:hypothetical protein
MLSATDIALLVQWHVVLSNPKFHRFDSAGSVKWFTYRKSSDCVDTQLVQLVVTHDGSNMVVPKSESGCVVARGALGKFIAYHIHRESLSFGFGGALDVCFGGEGGLSLSACRPLLSCLLVSRSTSSG